MTTITDFDLRNIQKLPDKILGQGASGTCYVGIDLSNAGKLYAVKEIALPEKEEEDHKASPSASSSSQQQDNKNNTTILTQKMQNEISICASIPPHPNIVSYDGSRLGRMIEPFESSNDDDENHHDYDEHQNDQELSVRSHQSSSTVSSSASMHRTHHRHHQNRRRVVASSPTSQGNNNNDTNSNNNNCLDIVMEICSGGSVSSILRSLNQSEQQHQITGFPEKLAKKYTVDLLLGVDHLHNVAHIVVRDIKGDNLLLSADGSTAKLCDFGASRKRFGAKNNNKNNNFITSSSTTTATTTAGTAVTTNTTTARSSMLFYTQIGTASYTAPEVANAEYNGEEDENENEESTTSSNSNKSYTSQADIWSIGCCVFEFLTGAPPCYGIDQANQFAIFFAIATKEDLVPDLNDESQVPNAKVRNSISKEAKDFVMKCCCVRDPKKRHNVRQLLRHEWVREEVEERVRILKKEKMMSHNRDTISSSSLGTLSSILMMSSVTSASSENEQKLSQRSSVVSSSAMSSPPPAMKTTQSGEGLMLPNGAFVDF